MISEKPGRQELHRREQQRNDERTYPGKEEELYAEASQQVGHASGVTDNLRNVSGVEEEQLVLLLIVQMMRIGHPEKEQDGHSEKTTYQIPY